MLILAFRLIIEMFRRLHQFNHAEEVSNKRMSPDVVSTSATDHAIVTSEHCGIYSTVTLASVSV